MNHPRNTKAINIRLFVQHPKNKAKPNPTLKEAKGEHMFMPPSRCPNFSQLYPSRTAFEDAQKKRIWPSPPVRSAELLAAFNARNRKGEAPPPQAEGEGFAQLKAIRANMQTWIVQASAGRIENMLLTVPTYWSEEEGRNNMSPRDERHYKRLAKAMGPNRTYTIVGNPDFKDEITSWFNEENVEIKFVSSPIFNYSIWAQDAYVALLDKVNKPVLVEGVLFNRQDDATIADDIADQTEIGALTSNLYFQGGNVLGGTNWTLIGQDYIHRNEQRSQFRCRDSVLDAFLRLFGTKIIPLGGARSGDIDWHHQNKLSGLGKQPIFHIDMYVTPTGVKGDSGKEIVMLGRPKKTKELLDRWSDTTEVDHQKYDEFFLETEEQLSDHFEVRHLPLMLTFGNLGFSNLEPKFYNLSFNNVVIEQYGEGENEVRKVIMPTYAEDSEEYGTDMELRQDLENAAASEWKALGFEVERMDGLEDLAYAQGSVHCITKALIRW